MASDIDLRTLDNYLSSEDSPDKCMMLSDMDGFLHGTICSPVTIPSDTWMPVALGTDPKQIPNLVLHGITDHFMEITQCLTHIPPTVEPIFWQAKEGHVITMCERQDQDRVNYEGGGAWATGGVYVIIHGLCQRWGF